jgi:hypothetical protein
VSADYGNRGRPQRPLTLTLEKVNMSMDSQLHAALLATIRAYRDRAGAAGLRHLRISIETSGRVNGDFKIKYEVREDYESACDGSRLEDVFVECLRRKGWNESHKPLALPNIEGGDTAGDYCYE